MVIGIICAEKQELQAVKENMKDVIKEKQQNLTFYKCKQNEKNCILVECGIGKVNAARTTQILIDKYNVDIVINVGSAGAVNPKLNIGDIVIGEKLMQYDFDLTALGNYKIGEIYEIGAYMYSDEKLVSMCKNIINSMPNRNYNICTGIIGTADMFMSDKQYAKQLNTEFNIECTEMEGAAVAQVCNLCNTPCLVIRGISDSVNGNNSIDFHTYLQEASKKAANILFQLIEKI